MQRRAVAPCLLALTALSPLGCAHRNHKLVAQIDEAITRAAEFMVGQQGDDGAWRSNVYGVFRDGASLTPHVLTTLHAVHDLTPGGPEAFRSGADYFASLSAAEEDPHLAYPVYSAAPAVWLLSLENPENYVHARSVYLRAVLERHFTMENEWLPSDPAFGGWGYSTGVPTRRRDRAWLGDANISATVYALGAVRAARASSADSIRRDALRFVQRCQNFADHGSEDEPLFDDGGFFFSPVDPARNKAGVAGTDRRGRERYASYGSATADGLRALLQCGLPMDHPRVVAARNWLERNFTATSNPGQFRPECEVLRDGYYYYYCWSVAHAFRALGQRKVSTKHGRVDWATTLVEELLRRQRADGGWANTFTDAKEDDPLVATPFATAALALCRCSLLRSSSAGRCGHMPARGGPLCQGGPGDH